MNTTDTNIQDVLSTPKKNGHCLRPISICSYRQSLLPAQINTTQADGKSTRLHPNTLVHSNSLASKEPTNTKRGKPRCSAKYAQGSVLLILNRSIIFRNGELV
jgi:hypothetical protein